MRNEKELSESYTSLLYIAIPQLYIAIPVVSAGSWEGIS